jgi:hypothetical protein
MAVWIRNNMIFWRDFRGLVNVVGCSRGLSPRRDVGYEVKLALEDTGDQILDRSCRLGILTLPYEGPGQKYKDYRATVEIRSL